MVENHYTFDWLIGSAIKMFNVKHKDQANVNTSFATKLFILYHIKSSIFEDLFFPKTIQIEFYDAIFLKIYL